MRIAPDDPLAADVRALLEEHLADMRRISPPESVHALDPELLAAPEVRFLTARDDDGTLLGCGAVKSLGDGDAELKSMRTAPAARGRGYCRRLIEHGTRLADAEGRPTYLESSAARNVPIYRRMGFRECRRVYLQRAGEGNVALDVMVREPGVNGE